VLALVFIELQEVHHFQAIDVTEVVTIEEKISGAFLTMEYHINTDSQPISITMTNMITANLSKYKEPKQEGIGIMTE